MTTDRETAEVIRSWMKQEVGLNDAGIHRVLARLPDTPQRRHRWLWSFEWRPFGSGATRSAGFGEHPQTRRYSSMITAARIVATAAIVALGGALMVSVASPNVHVVAPPGAEAPDEVEALDGAWLATLNEPDMIKVHALAAEAFTEDATFTMVWGPDDMGVDPDRAHISTRFTDPMTATRTEPLVELPAGAGEQRFVGIYEFRYGASVYFPGTVCSAWAREGLVYRLDCLFPDPNQVYPYRDE